MISLKTLITISPFSEDMQKNLMDLLPNMSEEKKLEITDLCWTALITQYDNKVQQLNEDTLLATGLDKKTYSDEELQQKQNEILDQLAKKIFDNGETGALQETRDELAEIRSKLSSQKTSQ